MSELRDRTDRTTTGFGKASVVTMIFAI
jgi:hypothetical protein